MNNSNSDNQQIRNEISELHDDIDSINGIIVEIPTDYVSTQTFNNYKQEVNQKLGRVYTVKGSVANYTALTNLTNNQIGDVYNLLDTGANYVYTSSGWDKLSETVDLRSYITQEDAELQFVTIEDYNDLLQRVEDLENNSTQENGGEE